MPAEDLSLLVNGEPLFVRSECTVEGLLDEMGLTGARIAIAVNRNVVPRSTYPSHRLATGDRIEVLEAVGGG